MPADRPPLAARLDAERVRRGLTYRELAETSGLPLSRVQAILSGDTPNPGVYTVRAVCLALGRDLGWLARDLPTA